MVGTPIEKCNVVLLQEETIKLYTLLREGDVDGLTNMYKNNKIDLSANLDVCYNMFITACIVVGHSVT